MKLALLAIGLLFLIVVSATAQQPPADLVILHGHVWTVDHAHPLAEAVAIHGNRIVAVGSDAEIAKWIGPTTRRIDAEGKSVLPGFIDAHVHFSSGGGEISGVQLRDAATPQEFARRIAEHAKKLPKGEWMRGGTWDHELWGGNPLPSHDWIDALTPETPVFVTRYDGHMALANGLALRLAGITRESKDPPGGSIVRDKEGNPTGLLKDAAMGLVGRVMPPPSEGAATANDSSCDSRSTALWRNQRPRHQQHGRRARLPDARGPRRAYAPYLLHHSSPSMGGPSHRGATRGFRK